MDEETPEKAKARRDLRILVVFMAVGIVLPLALFALVQLRVTR
jgi:hypothetical protein